MWPDFVRCVLQARPRAFIAENVPGMLDAKFAGFVRKNILAPLEQDYTIFKFSSQRMTPAPVAAPAGAHRGGSAPRAHVLLPGRVLPGQGQGQQHHRVHRQHHPAHPGQGTTKEAILRS